MSCCYFRVHRSSPTAVANVYEHCQDVQILGLRMECYLILLAESSK